MQMNEVRANTKPERKIINVSVKRQLTIPQKYYENLGFGNEAECILHKGGILIRPVRNDVRGDFSEQILSDLINQGYEGSELLVKFKEYSRAIRPAVEKLIDETESYVNNGNGNIPRNELFGVEE